MKSPAEAGPGDAGTGRIALGGLSRVHADLFLSALVPLKLHDAVDFGEERVVRALADIKPGEEPRAALPDEDGSRGDDLAAVSFHSQPLPVRVSSVLRRSL